MLEVYQRLGIHCDEAVYTQVALNHEQRNKGRLKLFGKNGEEIRVFLERGKPLLVGEYLKSECGKYIKIEGQVELITEAACDDWHSFSKACYHLGNRHVKVQIGERCLRITPDHVLEEMLQNLGLTLVTKETIFLPESGAYKDAHHGH